MEYGINNMPHKDMETQRKGKRVIFQYFQHYNFYSDPCTLYKGLLLVYNFPIISSRQ